MKETRAVFASAFALAISGCGSNDASAFGAGGSGGAMTAGGSGGATMTTGGSGGAMTAGGSGGAMTAEGSGGAMATGGAAGAMAAGGDSGAPADAGPGFPDCSQFPSSDAGAGSGGAGTAGGTIAFCDDFESGAGQWTLIERVWAIDNDDSAVYASANDPANAGEARTSAGDPTWTDMTITGRVKVTSMDPGRRIYLAGRFVDANNWYGAALYNSGTRRVAIRKKVAGSTSDIGTQVEFPFTEGTWYEIRFQISGTQLSMSVDGVELVSGVDESFSAGSIALLADRSVVSWDDIVVTTP